MKFFKKNKFGRVQTTKTTDTILAVLMGLLYLMILPYISLIGAVVCTTIISFLIISVFTKHFDDLE